MTATFKAVADIIAEVCSIEPAKISPTSHTIDDLGIDSLDFLDVAFAIDKKFGIKMPIERWMQEVNEGKTAAEDYFVLDNLCSRIDELVAAKAA
jgi:acyl carrier protein